MTVQVNAGQIAIARPGQAPTFATTFPFAASAPPPQKKGKQQQGSGDDSNDNRPLNRVMVNRLYKRAIQTSDGPETHSPIPEAQSPASRAARHQQAAESPSRTGAARSRWKRWFSSAGLSVGISKCWRRRCLHIRIDPIADITPEAGSTRGNC